MSETRGEIPAAFERLKLPGGCAISRDMVRAISVENAQMRFVLKRRSPHDPAAGTRACRRRAGRACPEYLACAKARRNGPRIAGHPTGGHGLDLARSDTDGGVAADAEPGGCGDPDVLIENMKAVHRPECGHEARKLCIPCLAALPIFIDAARLKRGIQSAPGRSTATSPRSRAESSDSTPVASPRGVWKARTAARVRASIWPLTGPW